MYHIHEKPVPSDGNCTGAGAHLDPMSRGEDPACDSKDSANCQVGDLSGKHGMIPELPGFNANYTDKYLSLSDSVNSGSFIGNRSVVIHTSDKTRIACANIKLVQANSSSSSSSSVTGSGALSTVTSTYTSGSLSGSKTTYTTRLGGSATTNAGSGSLTAPTSSSSSGTGNSGAHLKAAPAALGAVAAFAAVVL